MATTERLEAAFGRVTAWMRAHEAAVLADNLAPGATPERLEETARALGFPLPPELEALWRLHDGQNEEQNGFVEWRDLLDTRRAVGELESALPNVEFLREHPDDFEEAGVSPEEIASDRWVPFAGRDSDLLLVSGVTGRVFSTGDQFPVVKREASSLVEFFERYAARVEAEDFAVEEGFGDVYLSERDRAKEARDAERARKREDRERFERVTPLRDQLTGALKKGDGDDAMRVLERAEAAGPTELHGALAALFTAEVEDDVVATALRPLLSTVSLTPDQWGRVAAGGARLDNNAILDAALPRCAGCSKAALDRFEASVARAPEHQRQRLFALLARLRPARRWWRFWS